MLYYLFDYLDKTYDFPGAGLFQYISFRAAMAALLALIIAIPVGKRIIALLRHRQIGETIRQLGLEGEDAKRGTPTMGGLIILISILLPAILFARLDNIYVLLLFIGTLWMGLIGAIDDYIKVFRKNKAGISGKIKLLGQAALGLIVAVTLFYHPDVTVRQYLSPTKQIADLPTVRTDALGRPYVEGKSLRTTIPFTKNNELDYARIWKTIAPPLADYAYIFYILVVIFIITAVSNGVNLTDGLDGLAVGVSVIVIATLALFAYFSGNILFAGYFRIMYIPNLGELSIFAAALIGACIGFLWYNAYPAQVFMGDTGSLLLGGVIGIMAVMVRKELILPLLGGIFLIESLSVILQVAYFKYTRRKYGQGRRIFKMAPIHHHYQKKGLPEAKIVVRFWIVAAGLALLSILTLKVR